MHKGIGKGIHYALLAAVLFGASTPLAKLLLEHTAPVALAALLYLGSGIGLLLCFAVRARRQRRQRHQRHRADRPAGLARSDLPWLGGAIASGGVAGPVLLLYGLAVTPASSAALLLNMEGVLTALLAWFVFRESFDRRLFAGMVLIVVAGVLLSWQQTPAAGGAGVPWGALAIVGACLCWGIDNNLTRKVAASDALQIACVKGLVAGSVNLALAWVLGAHLPTVSLALAAGVVGFAGYGLSLVLFVLALRHLGTARTGAYFSAAPFVGALIALALGDAPAALFWPAAALMAAGIWLHVTESHGHAHTHEPLLHGHPHRHDAHHQHQHDFEWNGEEPHVHPHQHAPLTHSHAHYPDIHHRHSH